MIPAAYVTAWRSAAPWADEAQVEQDLVLSRAMVDLFSDERVSKCFAMRGGTALHKLGHSAPLRYSEDVDLVQVVAGPIQPFFDALRERVDPWLGAHVYEHREHFALLGLRGPQFLVDSPWFRGEAEITTFELDELLGTKLRALYQRSKGRDLFDLHEAGRRDGVDPDRVLETFREYLARQGARVGRAEFLANLASKVRDRGFRADVARLLAPDIVHDVDQAARWLSIEWLERLP